MSATTAVEPFAEGAVLTIERLAAACRWVEEQSDPAVLRDVIDEAKIAATWVRTYKAGAELASAVNRLVAIALRRLGQLGALDDLHSNPKGVARWLASQNDDQVRLLLSQLTDRVSVYSLHRLAVREETAERDRENVRAAIDGEPRNPEGPESISPEEAERWRAVLSSKWAPEEVREAATSLLEAIVSTRTQFEVDECVVLLAARLDVDPDDSVTRLGLASVVRTAIRLAEREAEYALNEEGQRIHLPGLVTYYEVIESGGSGVPPIGSPDWNRESWVRVPARSASLEQFRHMVAWRLRAAEAVMEAAQEYERALVVFEATAAETGDTDLLTLRKEAFKRRNLYKASAS